MAAFTAAWLSRPGTLKVSCCRSTQRCPSLVVPRRAVPSWRGRRAQGRRRPNRGRWQLLITLAFCAGLVTYLLQTVTDDHFERSFLHHWHRWWRRHRSWFRGDRLAILIALLLALLSAPQRGERRRLGAARSTPSVRGRRFPTPARAPVQVPRSIGERRQGELDQLHAALQEGDALRAAILIDTWGQGDSFSFEPLQRPELQILLEEAARHAPQLLPVLAEQLEQRGVPLDWALGNDCRANFGRYALDAALEVLVKETRNEAAALSLLSRGEGSGKGDTSQLDADPLMRAAAAQGMTRLVERLVKDCGADVNSKDPRFGSSALDRALDAGKEQTSLKLLELGADPTAGKGVDFILARAGPKVRSELPKRISLPKSPEASLPTSEEDFAKLRGQLQKLSERMVLQELENKKLSKVQLAQLLQEAARIGYRPRLLQYLCDDLGKEVPLNWDEAENAGPSDAAFARQPLEVALETAVEENPDPRTAEWLLDEGIRRTRGRPRLNGNPLLRTAASRCQVSLVRRLVEVKADPSAPDPRYGSTALDRAVSAGCSAAAVALLELGADPHAGHGRQSLLDRASSEAGNGIPT